MDATPERDISRISRSPIRVEITPMMNYELKNVIQCDIAQVKQVLLEFSSVCLEIRNLVVECREMYLPALCVYNSGSSEKRSEREIVRSVGHLLPLLKVVAFDFAYPSIYGLVLTQDLLRFIHRCDAAVHRLISLMHMVYYEELSSKWKTSHLHLPTVFDFLAQILASLVSLDMAIQMHVNLKDDWTIYSRFVKTIFKNDAATGTEKVKLKMVEKMLKAIDMELFKGHIFKSCAAKRNAASGIRVNDKLVRQFSSMTRTYALKADNPYSYEYDMETHIMCACALLSFGHLYFRRIDKKLLHFFWKRFSKTSAFTFCCNIHWQPCEFLYRTSPDIRGIVDTSSALNLPPKCNIDFPMSSQIFELSHHELVTLEVTINSACQPESVLKQSPRKFTSILFRVSCVSVRKTNHYFYYCATQFSMNSVPWF
ncbi:hypothetical protein D918_09893 [Trichuris suis]|nr:hypothetical protein D918_09893 [Trichuris suis]